MRLAQSCRHCCLCKKPCQKDKEEKTPFEKSGRKPKTNHLKVFGCLAYVNNRKREKFKFDPKARKHVFLGYDGNSTAYLLQDIKLESWHDLAASCSMKRNNETRENENDDLLFDVTFDDEIEQSNA